MGVHRVVLVAAAAVVAIRAEVFTNENVIFPQLINSFERSRNLECKRQSELYREHLENLTLWAYEMWDASAKLTTGLLRGNIYQLGDWDQCITIAAPYQTQYCIATLTARGYEPETPRDPLSLHYSPFDLVLDKIYRTEEISVQSRHAVKIGLCMPAACTQKDMEDSMNQYLANLDYPLKSENVTYNVKMPEKMCQTEDDRYHFDEWDMAFGLLTLIIIVLVILSTLFDYCRPAEAKSDKKPARMSSCSKICLAFSVRRNFLDLPKSDESNSALSILYGIKTISIFVIIGDHRFGTFLSGPIMNYDYIEQEYRAPYAAFIFHGDLFVDSFFVLSGLLVTYCLLVQFDKKIVNPLFIVFLRYVRLTPVYAVVVLYWASILNHLGSGPLWRLIVWPEVVDCRNNWWANILYISNYVNDKHMCMTHSWYLPCDFHYFIMGIIITLLIHKYKKLGLSLLIFLLILSMVIPFLLTIIYMRPALLQFYPATLMAPKLHPDFQLTYTKSHTRATSYIVGMFAGYFYYRLKDSSKKLTRVASHALTLVSLIIIFVSIATGTIFYDRYHEYNALESGAYAALHRLGWSVGTVGLLFSASYGHATVLKSILSWTPWIPLGKLVYGAYLVHMSFQFRSLAMTMSPKYFTYFDVISLALSDIALAFGTALLLYLGVEAPVRKIFKELMMPMRPPAVKQTPETNATQCETNNNHNPNNDSRL